MKAIKKIIKNAILALPPPVAIRVFNAIVYVMQPRSREFNRRVRNVYRKMGRPDVVLAGPFKGMKYIRRSTCSCLLPKLVGTYEAELHDAVRMVRERQCDLLVDIGSAEGYYAVGFALQMPALRIVCYDIYRPARYLLGKLARLNNVVHRIDQRIACSHEELEQVLASAKRPVVICDCEGAEDVVLNPQRTKGLAHAMLIVELHEGLNRGVLPRVRQQFEATHTIQAISATRRTQDMIPAHLALTAEEAKQAMDEDRVGAEDWFVMLPKQHGPAAALQPRGEFSR